MENEVLRIFDEHRNPVGFASREEVHRLGHWHETFHCWFLGREQGKNYIYLQLRSTQKKDYPGLLDITAAGHLISTETVRDGVREVKEEIGIDVSYDNLSSLGVVTYCVEREGFVDNELAHVFLHEYTGLWEDFTLQEEEVSGMVKVDFHEFQELWKGVRTTVRIEGFQEIEQKTRMEINEVVKREAFVPHGQSIYLAVLGLIEKTVGLEQQDRHPG